MSTHMTRSELVTSGVESVTEKLDAMGQNALHAIRLVLVRVRAALIVSARNLIGPKLVRTALNQTPHPARSRFSDSQTLLTCECPRPPQTRTTVLGEEAAD